MELASFLLFGRSQALQLALSWVTLSRDSCPLSENIPTMQYFIFKKKNVHSMRTYLQCNSLFSKIKMSAFYAPEHYHKGFDKASTIFQKSNN